MFLPFQQPIWMRLLNLASLLLCGLSVVDSQPEYTDTLNSQLTAQLRNGYDRWSRPNASVVINAMFSLTNINSLDTVNQELDIAGGFSLSWMDHRLQWNLTDFNVSYTHLTMSSIWTPPLVIYNDVDGRKIFSDNSDLQSELVFVFGQGWVVWPHATRIRSQCDVNIRFYPFDTQTCYLQIGPWGVAKEDIRLEIGSPPVDTSVFKENGEWTVVDTSAGPKDLLTYGLTFGFVEFGVQLHRKQSYYILNIILPVVFLAFLGPVVFVLPVESGEKAGFSLTVLLSLSVVLNLVSDRIPTTSTHVCYLSVYLLVTYVACVLEVLMTILTLRLFNLHEIGYPLPESVDKFIRKYLATLLCYKRVEDLEGERNKSRATCFSREGSDIILKDVDNDDIAKSSRKNGKPLRETDLPLPLDRLKSNDVISDTPYTYKEACFLLDKLNFIIFELLTLVITLSFLITISLSG